MLLDNIEIGVLKLLEKQNLSIIKGNSPIVPQIQEFTGVRLKELENKHLLPQGPVSLKSKDIVVTDKAKVADLLNKQFIRASNLFENHVPIQYIDKTRHIRNIQTILPFSFSLKPVNKLQVWHELRKLKKSLLV